MALSLSAAASTSVWAQQYTISTVVGNGSVTLNGPIGLTLDASQNLYIADVGNDVIREVSGGTIPTVAGNGSPGYAGDGGPATSAQLFSPTRVALDSSGNLYIADAGNSVIRMVTPGGTISTIAGNVCTSGQTTPCDAGLSGDGGAATAAQLNTPLGVALDSANNLYIADSNNNLIRVVSNGIISSLHLSLILNHPADVAVDSENNLYIADLNNSRIVKVTPARAATVFAGSETPGFSGDGGPAAGAELFFPAGVAVDGAGNVYIADTLNNRIRMVTNGTINTIAGSGQNAYTGDGGPASAAALSSPRGVTVDPFGDLYVADSGNNVIRLLQPPAPFISANGVVNAASFRPNISPGALATVFGTNFLAASASASALPLLNHLNGVQVSVGGQLAPILFVNSTQVNFQVPRETGTGTVSISLSRNGVVSNTVTAPVLEAAPGLFTESSGAAVVQNSDYSLNQPSNPAAAGSTIIAYFTGTGPVSGTVADGSPTPSSSLFEANQPWAATIGSMAATVSFAGLAPGFVGLGQANIVIPSGIAPGSYPLTITLDGQTSNSGTVSVN